MVEQPIQRCRCCRRVTEDRSPFSWYFITGHNDAFRSVPISAQKAAVFAAADNVQNFSHIFLGARPVKFSSA